MSMILDGDFAGHPFRGSQWVTASGESKTAVHASKKAKRAERAGDAAAQKKAHKIAHHAHMAAAEEATTEKSRKYHETMAKFHGGRAGVKLDSVALDGIDDVASAIESAIKKDGAAGEYGVRAIPRGEVVRVGQRLKPSFRWEDGEQTEEELNGTSSIGVKAGGAQAAIKALKRGGYAGDTIALIVGDRAESGDDPGERVIRDAHVLAVFKRAVVMDSVAMDGIDADGYVGKVYRGAELIGRVNIADDGKAMVFVGPSGDQRVTEVVLGERTPARYSDADTGDLIGMLLENLAGEQASQPAPIELPYKFASATQQAMRLFSVAHGGGAPKNAYKTAVRVEESLPNGTVVNWDSVADLPDTGTRLDDVAGLFGADQGGGYVVGEVKTSDGKLVATVTIRGDGAAMFEPSEAYAKSVGGIDPDDDDEGWGSWIDYDMMENMLTELHDAAADMRPPTEQEEEAMAAQAERDRKADEEQAAADAARQALADAAKAFGEGKKGFLGVVDNPGKVGVSVSALMQRKPAGSFVFVVDRDWKASDAAGKAVFGVAMWSRQKLGKSGRSIDPNGKIGNVQLTILFDTPEQAYLAGTKALTSAGGVVLGGEQEPAGKAFTVRGVDFEAVRFMVPIPHWRLKILETGEVWEPGTGGVKGDSVPKLIASVEDLASRSKTDAEWRFNLGLPKKDALAAAYRYAMVNRPAMIGGLPRGLTYTVESRPAAGQPHYEMARHGILVADRELTEAELKSFELAELIEGPALDRVAAEVADGMRKYAAQYVEAEQDNPGMFRDQVLDKAEKPASGVMRSIASPDALVDRVLVLLQDMAKASGEAKPEPAPAVGAAPTSAALTGLRDIVSGKHDSTPLPDLLAKIEELITALGGAEDLTGEPAQVANDAITHWVKLDEKANG